MAVNAGLLEFCRSAAYLRICPAPEASSEACFMSENRTPERFGWGEWAGGLVVRSRAGAGVLAIVGAGGAETLAR
jgi:hypothetical protein